MYSYFLTQLVCLAQAKTSLGNLTTNFANATLPLFGTKLTLPCGIVSCQSTCFDPNLTYSSAVYLY